MYSYKKIELLCVIVGDQKVDIYQRDYKNIDSLGTDISSLYW